jgi:hypothetical protein
MLHIGSLIGLLVHAACSDSVAAAAAAAACSCLQLLQQARLWLIIVAQWFAGMACSARS